MSNQSSSLVLILVLVEHTLGEVWVTGWSVVTFSLNPCFSGTYSRSPSGEQSVRDTLWS